MQSITFLFVLLSSSLVLTAKIGRVPPYFPKCYRDDPNFSECLVEAANAVKPYLIKGVPELNLPPITPFVIPEVKLEQGTSAVNLKAVLKNITFVGFESYHFSKYYFSPKDLTFDIKSTMGKIHVTSDYELSGKILLAPIEGKGTLSLNVYVNFTDKAILVQRDGVTYIQPKDLVVKVKFGKSVIHFDGLFGGNEELATVTNNAINENSEELVKEITPTIENVMQEIIKDLLTRSIGRTPYDEVYPKRSKR